MQRRRLAVVGILAALLSACTEEKPKPKEAEKPPEAITGREALYKVYGMARTWAPDIQGLKVGSIPVAQVKAGPGKSGAWEVTFYSPSRAKARSFTYSVVEVGGNLHQGPFGGLEEDFTPGPHGMTWPVTALKKDSDEAYQIAAAKSKTDLAKIGDTPMFYLLQQTNQFPDLAWRVVWGESVNTSKYSAFVDASTGEFLQKGH